MPNDIIPSFNSIREETIHVPAGLATYFVNVINFWPQGRVSFVDKMVSLTISKSFEYTNGDRMRTHNPILHIERPEPCHVPVTLSAKLHRNSQDRDGQELLIKRFKGCLIIPIYQMVFKRYI